MTDFFFFQISGGKNERKTSAQSCVNVKENIMEYV